MKIRPVQDHIVIKRSDAEERTQGGIIVPDQARERPSRGKVVAVGPGLVRSEVREQGVVEVPPLPQVGDIVLFSAFAGTDIKVDGEDLVVVREGDILVILSE